MRKLSSWARRNPWRARMCIILLYWPLNIAGLITGDLLFDLGITLPGSFLIAAMAVVAFTVVIYPQKHALNPVSKTSFYVRRKISDLVLIGSTFLMICFTGNQTNVSTLFYPLSTKLAGTSAVRPATTIKGSTGFASGEPASKKLRKKEIRRNLRHFIQQWRKSYKERTKGEKGVLIALTIIGALLLFFVIAGLSCSIGCGGAEALAYIVFILGTFGIVFLTVKLIQSISRGRPKTKQEEVPVAGNR